MSNVSHDLVVRVGDLLAGGDLLPDHPLEELAVDAERVDAQFGAGQHLHDEVAFHALLELLTAQLHLQCVWVDLAGVGVAEEVGVVVDDPESATIDPVWGLQADLLSAVEAGADLDHGLLGADGFDAFRAVSTVRQPTGERDLVVDGREGLVLTDGVYRGSVEVGEVVARQRERPEGADVVLVDDLVELGRRLSLAAAEVGHVDHGEVVLGAEERGCTRQHELNAGAHCGVDEELHAVGECGQDVGLGHGVSLLGVWWWAVTIFR